MKLSNLLMIAAMALSVFAIKEARYFFEPTDLDLQSDGQYPLVYEAPAQKNLGSAEFTFEVDGAILVPRAIYDIKGLVLSKRRYLPWGNHRIAPWDIGMGWGVVSNPENLKHLTFWQVNRFLFWRYKSTSPIQNAQIIPSTSNTHVIPANEEVRAKLAKVKSGNIVRLSGFLVDVADGEIDYRTSMSRHDTGDGACEILYVQDVDLDP